MTQPQSAPLRHLRPIALVVCLALAAGACTKADDDLGDPTGRVQSTDTLDPESIPALASVAATGPAVPVFDGAVVDQASGLATSVEPTLRWTGATGPGPYRFTIRDLGPDGGTELWSSGDEPVASVRVPAGILAHGRAYRWSVVDGTGAEPGKLAFRVDVQRDDVQPQEAFGPVAVARVSGEAWIRWQSPTVSTVDGELGFSLSHRPSDASVTTPGLPEGWTLGVGGPSEWRTLRVNDDDTITLTRADGLTVVWEPNPGEDGGYRAVWGERQDWPTGTFATLTANDDRTFTVQDTGGTVTTFGAPGDDGAAPVTSVWNPSQPTPTLTYDGGRLVGVTDPVSQRTIRLAYGPAGSDVCPAASAPGLVDAPDGMLCTVTFWDGTVVRVGYVAGVGGAPVRLGRLVAHSGTRSGTEVTDLAWDGAGRLAAVRSPQAALAVAAGSRAPDASTATTVSYDDRGRVARIESPMPTAGAARAVRTFSYRLEGDTAVSELSAPAAAGASVLSRVEADAATFQGDREVDAGGAVSTTSWDRASDRVIESTDPAGLITRYEVDDLGQLRRQVGPATAEAVSSGAAPVTEIDSDLTFSDAEDLEGEPMTGLATTYWSNTTRTGTPARSEVGPLVADGEVPDEYRFSWGTSPVGGDDWSARLSGVLRVPAAGRWSVTTGGAPLWIDETPCRPTCSVDVAAARPLRVRLDVTGPSGDVDLTWAGPGASGTVPGDALAPALGRVAANRVADADAVGSGRTAVARTEWSDPVASVIGASYTNSGETRKVANEPYRPSKDQWARATSYTTPEGDVRELDYHPATGKVDDPCDGGAHVQGGLVAANIDPAGGGIGQVRAESVYDDGGRVVASRAGDDEPWTCTTYDDAGRPVRTIVGGATGDEEREVTYAYTGPSAASANDPLVAVVTSTTADGDRATELTEVDVLGRVVRSVDLWGTTVAVTYDPQYPERVLTETVTPQGAPASVTAYAYDVAGNRTSQSLDGVTVSTTAYDDAARPVSAVDGPATTAVTYDAGGRPADRLTTGAVGTWAESRTYSPTGRVLSVRTDGDGARDATTTYTYDEDFRLATATLDTTLPVTERAWTYSYDGDNNLVSRTITAGDGTTSTVRNDVADGDRLTSTDDPLFADPEDPARSGTVTHDDTGRITQLGPLDLAYDPSGQVAEVSHSDGSSVSFTSRFGRVVQRSTVPAGGGDARVVRFSSGGVVLDGTGAYQGRVVRTVTGSIMWTLPGGAALWTYPDLAGNPWFSADGTGAVSRVELYEPFGRQLLPVAPRPAAAPPSTSTSTTAPTTTSAPSTTAAPTTTAPSSTTTSTTPTSSTTTSTTAPTTVPATTAPGGGASGSTAGAGASSTTAPTSTTTTITAPSTTTTTAAPAPAAPQGPSAPVASGYRYGSTTTLGVVDLIPMGARLYVPGLGRFVQPDPVPGATGNPYAYTDGDPVNGHDTSGAETDWDTVLAWGVVVAGLIAAVAAPAAGKMVAQSLETAAKSTRVAAGVSFGAFVGAFGAAGLTTGVQVLSGGDADGSTILMAAVVGLIWGAASSRYSIGQLRPRAVVQQAPRRLDYRRTNPYYEYGQTPDDWLPLALRGTGIGKIPPKYQQSYANLGKKPQQQQLQQQQPLIFEPGSIGFLLIGGR